VCKLSGTSMCDVSLCMLLCVWPKALGSNICQPISVSPEERVFAMTDELSCECLHCGRPVVSVRRNPEGSDMLDGVQVGQQASRRFSRVRVQVIQVLKRMKISHFVSRIKSSSKQWIVMVDFLLHGS